MGDLWAGGLGNAFLTGAQGGGWSWGVHLLSALPSRLPPAGDARARGGGAAHLRPAHLGGRGRGEGGRRETAGDGSKRGSSALCGPSGKCRTGKTEALSPSCPGTDTHVGEGTLYTWAFGRVTPLLPCTEAHPASFPWETVTGASPYPTPGGCVALSSTQPSECALELAVSAVIYCSVSQPGTAGTRG